jgi:hypothetical protein
VYRRALFALTPGPVRVPAARLTYALAAGVGFFSPERTVSVRSNTVQLSALEPPAAGRPSGWEGAVGTLRASARTNARTLRAGDALEYSVDVDGTGNIALLPRPRLVVPWADVVTAGDTASVDSAAAQLRGRRTFAWLLTPRTPGRFSTPAVAYPYFDPTTRAYAATQTAPLAVEVAPGAAPGVVDAAAPAGPRGVRLSIRTRWRGEADPPLATLAPFWIALGLAPLPAALFWVAAGARARASAATAGRVVGRVPSGGVSGAAALRTQLDQALARRVGFGVAEFGTPERLAAALRRVGVTTETAARVAALARSLDAAAYDAPGARAADTALEPLARECAAVRRDVDREARPREALVGRGRGEGAWLARVLVVCAAAGVCATAAACVRASEDGAADRAGRAFADGVAAYRAGNVARARSMFGAAVLDAPRAADAWVDAGTAAWAAADSVSAAVAWQRAIRLEPTAADVRERLALLPTAQDGPVAGVLPVPPDALALAALGLCAAAAMLALPGMRRRAGPALWAATWGASLAAGAGSWVLATRMRPDALAVVAAGTTLRAEPALDAEPGPRADATDVARVLGRTGTWARVQLDGARDGWIASDRLVPLVGPAERARHDGPLDPAR